jgi:hypothetical protein
MRRHLDKQKKCNNINNYDKTNFELDRDSLIKNKINNDVESILAECNIKKNINVDDQKNKFICEKCNKLFHNKSNLNKHIKNNTCIEKKETSNETSSEPIIQQINNIQNIGVQNNIINININSLKGFDEDWNISNITKDMKEKIILSDKKFTNTLENILKNDDNLNIILKDKVTGLVYKMKNNKYEAMPVKDIFDNAMDKIYKHLLDFFKEIITNNQSDISMNILENEIKEIDKKYIKYKKSIITNNSVNNCLSNIFDERKNDAILQYIKIKNNIDECEFNEIDDVNEY